MRTLLDRKFAVDYQVERSNDRWADHQLRTLVTGATIAWLQPDSVFDPACGDGSIVAAADRVRPIGHAFLADVSEPNIDRLVRDRRTGWQYAIASIETFIDLPNQIGSAFYGDVDVIVLTEILEHLVNPDVILAQAKQKARHLVASSPEMRPGQVDGNPEHIWMFDADGYREMLEAAGWQVVQHTTLRFNSDYDFGIWVCR